MWRIPAQRSIILGIAALACGTALDCSSPRAPAGRRGGAEARWIVIAPHPDDEALIASGVLLRAAEAGARPSVIVMTNGDLDCVHDGLRREAESIEGLRSLGLLEEQVFFLGYPDGGLALLGRAPLRRRRIVDGACAEGDSTYGARGFGRRDYHHARFGVAGSYTRESAVSDLASLLAELRPTDVATTHPEDSHPDHAATYALLRSALDRLPFAPRVHRAMVHNGDCWPTGTQPREPCPVAQLRPDQPTPPLSGRLAGYAPGERLAVPGSCLLPDRADNPKLRAIGAHVSQTRASPTSYLFAFARSDEVFFPETFAWDGGRWLRAREHRPAEVVDRALSLGPFDRRDVSLVAPISVSVDLARPAQAEGGRVARVGVLEDRSGSYTLEIDAERRVARLVRAFDASAELLLRRWPLPHDLWTSAGPELVELAIEPRPEDGEVAELTLRCRGELVGVAVDVRPRLRGRALSTFNVASVDGVVRVRGSSDLSVSPSARPAR